MNISRGLLKKSIMASEQCAICIEDLSGEQQTLECSHAFHSECIISWLDRSNSCPLCRCEIVSGTVPPKEETADLWSLGSFSVESFSIIDTLNVNFPDGDFLSEGFSRRNQIRRFPSSVLYVSNLFDDNTSSSDDELPPVSRFLAPGHIFRRSPGHENLPRFMNRQIDLESGSEN